MTARSILANPIRYALALALAVALSLGCAGTSTRPLDQAMPSDSSAQEAQEGHLVNTVTWSTEANLRHLGYRVYRAVTNGGHFEQINEEPIPASTQCQELCRYEFIDRTIDVERAYFYYVKVLLADGTEKLFTPVIRVPPKRPLKQDLEN